MLIAAALCLSIPLADVPPAATVVAHWSFDDAQRLGKNAAGERFTGELDGAPEVVPGRVGTALSLDGVEDSMTLRADGLFDGWAGASIAAWVRPRAGAPDKWPTLIEKASGGKPRNIHSLWLGLHGKSGTWALQLATDLEENLYRGLGTPARFGRWTHVVVTVDLRRHRARLYIDGELAQTRKLAVKGSRFRRNPTGPCAVGMIAQGQRNRWKGEIDELTIYKDILTQPQILDLAAVGAETAP